MAAFLDKAKQVAQQAIDEAKKGVEQGQQKLDEASAKREAAKLLATLGAAFYAEQRCGGTRSDVDAALQAVDQHVTVNGTGGFPSEGAPTTPSSEPPSSGGPTTPPATGQSAPPDAPRPPGA